MTAPDATALRERARQLLDGDVLWFPIRHHSPACAWHVGRLIRLRRPFAVLVEGPPDFDAVIPHLVHPDAVMPLAVHAHATLADAEHETRRLGFYYPLCDYSPELVALCAGAEVGARLGFADLDIGELARRGAVDGHALVDERAFAWSAALTELAERLGCRDHNELWDHLIETAMLSTEDLAAAVFAYGFLARIGNDHAAGQPDELDAAREHAMVRRVREECAIRSAAGAAGPIVVVTGAFHTAVLPDLFAGGEIAATVPQHRTDEVGLGVVRYSFSRLDALSGYAAGMRSPAWHQVVWDGIGPDGPTVANSQAAAHQLLGDVARLLRERGGDGQPATPSVVDAHVNAELLRQLRGRQSISLDDVCDAALSCFAKGEFGLDVQRELGELMTGDRVGCLAPGTPRTPLAVDFDRCATELGLRLDTTAARRLELAVHRSENDRRRSRLFHSLRVLGINYAAPLQLPHWGKSAVRDVTREVWSCQITAETDATLAEAALWGSTVAEAAAAALRGRFQSVVDRRGSSLELIGLVRDLLRCGLPEAVEPILGSVRRRLVDDPSLPSVSAALAEADLLWTGMRPLNGTGLTSLPALAEQLFLRSCALVPGVADLGSDHDLESVEALRSLHQVVATADWLSLDEALYWDALAAVRQGGCRPQLSGAVDGVSWHGGRFEDAQLRRAVSGHLASPDEETGAAYLAGLVSAAREVLWQVDGLLDDIGAALESVEVAQFVRRLPQLRAVFALLTPRETNRVAELVGRRGGTAAAPVVAGLGEPRLLANLSASLAVSTRLVDDGLENWLPAGADSETNG